MNESETKLQCKFEFTPYYYGGIWYECSNCGTIFNIHKVKYRYCPHCGAKITEVIEHEKEREEYIQIMRMRNKHEDD